MNFQELKERLQHKSATVVKDEDGTIMGVLSNLDNLKQLVEEHWDIEVISIGNCNVFDYGYKGELDIEVDDNGEDYTRRLELTVTFLY